MQASYLRVFWEWLARQLDFHFFVIAAGSEAKGGWTNGGSLVVPWKQWSICLVKKNTQLTFHRREQRTIMQCWPCPSFLLISQGSLLAAISCVMQITSGWHPAPSGLGLSPLLLLCVCCHGKVSRSGPCSSRFLISLPTEPIDHRQSIAKSTIHHSLPLGTESVFTVTCFAHHPAEMKLVVVVRGWSLSNSVWRPETPPFEMRFSWTCWRICPSGRLNGAQPTLILMMGVGLSVPGLGSFFQLLLETWSTWKKRMRREDKRQDGGVVFHSSHCSFSIYELSVLLHTVG